MAVGDAMGSGVHAAGNVAEELILTVGRVGRTAIDEMSNLLIGVVGGLRKTISAGVRGTGAAIQSAERETQSPQGNEPL